MKYENMVRFGRLESEVIDMMAEKTFIVDDVFMLLSHAYQNVKGGLHFESKEALLTSTTQWRVIYLDETIVGVVIYKAKKGLKMVAMAISDWVSYRVRKHIKTMLHEIFHLTFGKSWMEVSEGAEKFLMKIGGERFMVPNSYATALTGKKILSLDTDGYHYYREINGIVKRKIILGTIRDERKRC